MKSIFHPACLLAALAATFPAAAMAGGTTVTSRIEQNGAGACQGALPAFAGTLRARPLALQNEGGATAFVTCSLAIESVLSGGFSATTSRLRLFFTSAADVPRQVSCTLVDGTVLDVADYIVKATSIEAGGIGEIAFDLSDYPTPAGRIDSPNVSCALPPGIGIGVIWQYTTTA